MKKVNQAKRYFLIFVYLFYIAAKVIVRVPSNTAVVEGEKMVITCTVLGYKPRLSWSIIGEHHILLL